MGDIQSQPSPTTSYVALALSFFVGFAGFLGYRYIQTPKHTLPPVTPPSATIPESTPEPTFALTPPRQAVSGDFTLTKGKADIFARTADAYAEASPTAKILVGESVATKEESSASVDISNLVAVAMDEKTEIAFANLYPDNMVLLQKEGSATYKITGATKPISVRVLHNLIALESGEMTISIDDTDVVLSVSAGNAKLAQVDSENTTHVWNVGEKERAMIDDEAREVRVSKLR